MRMKSDLIEIYTKKIFEGYEQQIVNLNWDEDLSINDKEFLIEKFKEVLEDIGIEIIYSGDYIDEGYVE